MAIPNDNKRAGPDRGDAKATLGRFFEPLRQSAESIFDTLKGHLDLEQHGTNPMELII